MDNNLTTKKKILDIAFNLFASQGFASTSIRQIASSADVNISSIGYYFGGKEGLYREVINSHLKDFTNSLTEKISRESDIKNRIRLFAISLVDSLMDSPSILQIITRELVTDDSNIPPLIGDMISTFTDIFYSFFKDTGIEMPDKIETNSGIFDIFMLLAPVYFYFIVRGLIDKNILIEESETMKFREQLIEETYERGIKILGRITGL
jgi:AcrR family transcriptional regulator